MSRSKKSPLLVGIEGGGTKTTCLVVGSDGSAKGAGSGGPSNVLVVGKDRAKESVQAAVRGATEGKALGEEVLAVCLGAAGAGSPEGKRMMQEVLQGLHLSDRCIVVHDGVISLMGATGGKPGIVIAAGTGSVCFGMNSSGKYARSSGWGYVLGDEGSGYDIAKRAMTAALRAHDLRGRPTAMEWKLVKHLGLSSIEDLVKVVYVDAMPRDQISALAPLVLEAAREGDAVAIDILSYAGTELGLAVVAVAKQLEITGDDFDVATDGSVLEGFGRFVADPLRSVVLESAPHARITHAKFKPVVGAIMIAAKEAGIEVDDPFLERLKASARGLEL